MRALDLPVWSVDMALFGDPASHAEHVAGHPSASAAGAATTSLGRPPLPKDHRCLSTPARTERPIPATPHRSRTVRLPAVQSIEIVVSRGAASESGLPALWRRRVATNGGREALAEGVAPRPSRTFSVRPRRRPPVPPTPQQSSSALQLNVFRPLDLNRAARALEQVFRIEVAQLAEVEPGPLLYFTDTDLICPELAEDEFEARHEVALA